MNDKIRLCFVLPNVWALVSNNGDDYGGAEINLYNLALTFAEDPAYQVAFYVGDYKQPDRTVINNITFCKLPYANYDQTAPRFWRRWYRILREFTMNYAFLTEKSDFIITTCGGGILGRIALMNLFRRRKIIFRLAHDLDTDLNSYREEESFLSYLFYSYGLRHTNQIVAQTDYQKELLEKRLGLSSVVVRNGFFLQKEENGKKEPMVLWVSRGVPIKRPELFVQLARLVPDKKFVMVIPGKDEFRKGLERQASDLHNLTILEFVSFSEIQSLFDRAEWFVNTSEKEGFPNTFIQACLGGTPILSFNVNPDDVLGKFGIGRICGNDPEAAASIIRNVTGLEWQEISDRGLEYVKQFHNIYDKKREYAGLFRQLGGKH